MSDIENAMLMSAQGMRVQGTRIKVISENVANADTAANLPGETPYTRQQVTFKNILDRELGIRLVQIGKITKDTSVAYPTRLMPDHPGADENGIVQLSNVNPLIEMVDMREAQRSYEANLGMVEQSRSMLARTVDMLRN